MNFLEKHLKSSKKIQDLLEKIKLGKHEFYLTGVKGSLGSLLVSILVNNTLLPHIIVTSDNAELENFAEDFKHYSNKKNILEFPGPEIFIKDNYSFDDESRMKRYQTLCSLYQDNNQIIITTVESLKLPVPDIEELIHLNIFLRTGMNFPLNKLIDLFSRAGYERSSIVEHKGTFSVRGGIVDIFPLGAEYPLRIELFNDEIYSLRLFNLETQRSYEKINEIEIYPFSEPPGKKHLTDYFPSKSCTLFHFLKDNPDKEISQNEDNNFKVKPSEFLKDYINPGIYIEIKTSSIGDEKIENNFFPLSSKFISSYKANIDNFITDLKEYQKNNFIIFIFCDNKGQQDRMIDILEERNINLSHISIQVGKISAGFELPEILLAVIKDDEIFGRYEIKRKYPKFSKKGGAAIGSFLELREMDYVVHIYHGIGRYFGIERLKIEEKEQDFIKIKYAGNDKIYVPINQLNLVQKYIGDPDNPPVLTNLGNTSWLRNKEKVKKAVQKIAKELVEIYAAREFLSGHSYAKDTSWQREFEDSFIYEETPDQLNAVKEIKEDMEKPKPMDRLICGDVGYGKTEVAIRACFKAIMEGYQVILLVPTTILAQQHFKTFSDRMADYPITVEMLSRFRNIREQKKIIKDLTEGNIDLIIGTHRLIQDDIKIKNPGLLIIDEEHRFGVKQKEKIKKLRKLIDVLSLTATPIPRTLQMSLIEVRDMSVISTPPPGRVPIKTYVLEFNKDIIKNAIINETKRKGQIFYVHNAVETIESAALFIQELVPNVSVTFAHGQMKEKDLEKTMLDFLNNKYSVLVCTTIIESGLDIPNVNTIIIEQADHFGLAQLYQLKGRVGRCDRMAYAYLFYDNEDKLTNTARKRLEAIAEITELGSGFKIAMRDLEIRGAGNILGTAQHGHINAVGYDLYCELLKECIEELKGKKHEEKISSEINLYISNFLPDDYIPDSRQKISIYKRLAAIQEKEEVEDIEKELNDRYGNIPGPVNNLLNIIYIKILSSKAFIISIKEIKNKQIIIKFNSRNKLNHIKIAALYKQYPDMVNFFAGSSPELKIDINKITSESGILGLLKNMLHIII